MINTYNFLSGLLDSADPANCKHFWIGLKLLRANEKDNIVGYCQWTQQWSTMPFACHANTREGQYPWASYAGYPPEPNNWAGEEECVVIGHNTGVTQVLQTVSFFLVKIQNEFLSFIRFL
jgi:hypothetical protein